MISPWLDEMGHGEDGAEEDTYASYNDVGNTKERISAAHDRSSRDDDGLGALVLV